MNKDLNLALYQAQMWRHYASFGTMVSAHLGFSPEECKARARAALSEAKKLNADPNYKLPIPLPWSREAIDAAKGA